jgi:hypothetical protein
MLHKGKEVISSDNSRGDKVVEGSHLVVLGFLFFSQQVKCGRVVFGMLSKKRESEVPQITKGEGTAVQDGNRT